MVNGRSPLIVLKKVVDLSYYGKYDLNEHVCDSLMKSYLVFVGFLEREAITFFYFSMIVVPDVRFKKGIVVHCL